MLFIVFLLTGWGLCTTQGTKNADHLLEPQWETVKKTQEVLRTSSTLRLTAISEELARQVCTCLHSTLVKSTDMGAERSLACYLNANGIGSPVEDWAKLGTNVKVSVDQDEDDPANPYAFINVFDPNRMLPERWTDYYYSVIYATKSCFILRTTPGKTRKAPCVLFKLDNAKHGDEKDCDQKFRERCETAFPALESRARCEQIAKKAKN